jgi:hypothetical protein
MITRIEMYRQEDFTIKLTYWLDGIQMPIEPTPVFNSYSEAVCWVTDQLDQAWHKTIQGK